MKMHWMTALLLAMGASGARAADELGAIPSASKAVPNTANVLLGNVFEAGGVPVAAGRSPRALKVIDGVDVFAGVSSTMGYDSNVSQAVAGSETSSSLYRLRPDVRAEARYRADRYVLSYAGDFARYPNFSANSLNQNDLLFKAQNVFSARSALAWGASAADRYEPIGSTDRSVGSSSADHYRGLSLNATMRYGAEDATGRIELDGGWGSKEYLNNRTKTESFDVENASVALRFYYRAMPSTRLLAEYRRTEYDYVHDTRALTNDDSRYLLGLSWDASAALTGAVKLGLQQKRYDSPTRSDYTGSTWEASMRWRPLTYSSFDLVGGRSANDPDGSTGVPINKSLSIAWNHDWSSYVHSKLSAGLKNIEYRGTSRVDDEYLYGVGVTYDFRRWLGLGIEYSFSNRDSSSPAWNFTRRLALLKLEATF